jgi:hypothetical protein
MCKIKTALFQVITEPDNKTVCPARLMSISAFIQLSVMSAVHFARTGVFDVQAEAVGFTALLGGIGAALGLKKDSHINHNGGPDAG